MIDFVGTVTQLVGLFKPTKYEMYCCGHYVGGALCDWWKVDTNKSTFYRLMLGWKLTIHSHSHFLLMFWR